jgi:RHS repeat-associated protein
VVPTFYLYDVNDERIALGANGAMTTYPFKRYNVQGNTIYKHIFANGEPVADVQGSTTTAAVYYIHDDHLGGSSVISDANANVAQVLEYYPFGGTRLDQRPDNTFNEQRRSDGHEFDTGTGLLYEDARYLGPTLSRFLSEDPILITPPSGQTLRNLLSDPQKLNFYSYVQDNPLRYTDPTGLLSATQQSAIVGLFNQFLPQNAQQASALQGLCLAFGGCSSTGSSRNNLPRLIGNPTGSSGTFYYQPAPLQSGTPPYYLSQPLQPLKKALNAADQLGQQYADEIEQNKAEGKTWIAALQPRSPETQAAGRLVKAAVTAGLGAEYKLGVVGTAGLVGLVDTLSQAGNNAPYSNQDAQNTVSDIVTSGLTRGLLGNDESTAAVLTDISSEYILQPAVNNFVVQYAQ